MPTKNALHHGKTMHIACRRCGKRSYHVRHKTCSHCGYGKTSKMRKYNWTTKNLTRSRRIV